MIHNADATSPAGLCLYMSSMRERSTSAFGMPSSFATGVTAPMDTRVSSCFQIAASISALPTSSTGGLVLETIARASVSRFMGFADALESSLVSLDIPLRQVLVHDGSQQGHVLQGRVLLRPGLVVERGRGATRETGHRLDKRRAAVPAILLRGWISIFVFGAIFRLEAAAVVKEGSLVLERQETRVHGGRGGHARRGVHLEVVQQIHVGDRRLEP